MSFTLLIWRPFHSVFSFCLHVWFGIELPLCLYTYWHKRRALITTRPCFYWKRTTDSPHPPPPPVGSPVPVTGPLSGSWKENAQLFWCQDPRVHLAKHPVSLGREVADHQASRVHHSVRRFHSTHSYSHPQGQKYFFIPLYRTQLVTRSSVQGATQVTWSQADVNMTQDLSRLCKHLMH